MSDQELNVDLENEDDLEIVIDDDTPDADKGFDPLPEKTEEEQEEEEIAGVGERVKKRIDKLTAEKHDARRKYEAAQREAEEAARAVQVLLERDRAYQEQLRTYEGGFVNQAKGRVEAELVQAKAEFKAAFEEGNADRMAEAQDKIARLAPQHEQYSRYRPQEPAPQPQVPQAPKPQPKAYDPTADQNLKAFMDENPWFNTDSEMTAYAMGLHQQAAIHDPDKVGTPEYYSEISSKVKKAFGKEPAPAKPRTSPTAPVTRGAPSAPARKQVTLTASQVRLATRLGLTPRQYAESLLKEGNS